MDARLVKRFSPAIFEFFFEETRVLFSIFSSGQAQRYLNIRWIIPHGGGAVPPIVERWSRFGTEIFGGQVEMSSAEFNETLRKQFYFDLAGFVLPDLLPGLLRLVDPSRMLYGSDYPYTPARTIIRFAGELDADLREAVASEEDRAAIYHRNAEKLLSRKRAYRSKFIRIGLASTKVGITMTPSRYHRARLAFILWTPGPRRRCVRS